MRRIFSILLLLMAVAGVVIAYQNSSLGKEPAVVTSHELQLYSREAGFAPARLPQATAELTLSLSMTIDGRFQAVAGEPVLELIVTGDDTVVLRQSVDFARAREILASPQAPSATYRADVGKFGPTGARAYLASLTPLKTDGLSIESINLIVTEAAEGGDDGLMVTGLMMTVVGVIGFALTARRRRKRNPNSQPPPPRWGRG